MYASHAWLYESNDDVCYSCMMICIKWRCNNINSRTQFHTIMHINRLPKLLLLQNFLHSISAPTDKMSYLQKAVQYLINRFEKSHAPNYAAENMLRRPITSLDSSCSIKRSLIKGLWRSYWEKMTIFSIWSIMGNGEIIPCYNMWATG